MGAAFGAALLTVACSRSPDVVATKLTGASKEDASIIHSPPMFEPCRAGYYIGIMAAKPDASGWPGQFSGMFNFSLIESPSGEFQVLKDTSLLSGTGANGSKFAAIIPGGSSCVDGEFRTTLDDGTYQISAGSSEIKFHGWIKGRYSADFNGFTGSWQSVLQLVPTNDAAVFEVQGGWVATWSGEQTP